MPSTDKERREALEDALQRLEDIARLADGAIIKIRQALKNGPSKP